MSTIPARSGDDFQPFPMAVPPVNASSHQNPDFIRRTFSSIAGRYDLANHSLSLGIDFLWRRKAAFQVAARCPARVLDLATGSGDLALELRRRCRTAQVIGADFCEPMLREAFRKKMRPLVLADGTRLPFADGVFDAVTVAFGLRNMASREAALQEMARVLRPGGMVLIMDFSLPKIPLILPLYRMYLHHVLPRLAGLLTGKPEAYDYLGESIEAFPRHDGMLRLLESCGFEHTRQHLLSLGIASIYTGDVPESPGAPKPSESQSQAN